MRFNDHYGGLLIMTKMHETYRIINVYALNEIVPVVCDKTPCTNMLPIYGSTAPILAMGRLFSFLIFYTVGRTSWTGDQPAVRALIWPRHSLSG
jgi:hypothetical protein